MRSPVEFSHRTRTRALETLDREPFDLLVIGGGITGAGIARDAALRGMRVLLTERRDFAVGTSSRSSKLIHGGVRYLQQGDVGLVMEAANERRVLRRLVPYLARPIQMLVPAQRRSGYAKLSAGLWTFDRMARVSHDERNQMLDREETLRLEPLLRADNIYGAAVYYECLTDDARLVLENLKSAVAFGATAVNYAPVERLVIEGGKVVGAVVRDVLGERAIEARASVAVNAAGPWVDEVRLLQGGGEKPRLHLTKGIHLIVPRERLPVVRSVVMTARDKRPVFAVPRGDTVYLGTTDTNYDGQYDDPAITREDVQYLLDAANDTFDVAPLGFDDVVGAWAGLRPLLHQDGKKPEEISRKDEIMVGPAGLISIAGGKLTTYRRMAERVVDMAAERAARLDGKRPHRRGESDSELLCGGATDEDLAAFIARLRTKWPEADADIVERLVGTYGSNGSRIVEGMMADPALGERAVPDLALTRGEVAYAVHDEMAMTLEDVLERRTRLFLWDVHNGLTAAPRVADWMAQLLGWSPDRRRAELAAYEDHVRDVKGFLGDAEPEELRALRA
ncbi:glycerol-3-phosphate dehydrogenase/oxidase [Candidatus Binatia bacterium]|nr:glycerol-3-phosphate dehydrogenase/oxidase [Candidatus Binatia bacterium]